MSKPNRLVVFTCNWNAYSGLETAGARHMSYPPEVLPIKVNCLGQISPGLILKAFQKGATGVLLLGCPEGACHYEFGNRRASEVFAESQRLARLLGYRDEQLALEWLAAGEGESFVEAVQTMSATLQGKLG